MDKFSSKKPRFPKPEGRQNKTKRKRSESLDGFGKDDDTEGLFESQKDLMQDVSYFPVAADKFAWQKMAFDPKLFGKKADLAGLLSIETLGGDDADELLRKMGHNGDVDKKIRKKKNKGPEIARAESPAESDIPSGKKGRRKRYTEKKQRAAAAAAVVAVEPEFSVNVAAPLTSEESCANEDAGDQCTEQSRPIKKSAGKERKIARKLKQLKAKRAIKKAVRKQHEQDQPDDSEHVENEEDNAAVDLGEDGVAQASNRRSEDPTTYDDEWEYSEWGGISMRKCLLKALEDLNFTEPTPIQKAVLPVAMSKRCDIFGAAETGSGKTLAFALPMLQRILDSHSFSGVSAQDRHLAALVLSPTRELAIQVRDHIAAAAKYTPIKVVGIIGGLAVQKQERLLAMRPHIVVGTPGRLWEQMQHGDGYLTRLHMLLCLVIDEADRMLETGHFAELESILGVLPAVDPSKRRKAKPSAAAAAARGGDSDSLADEDEGDNPVAIDTFKSSGGGGGDSQPGGATEQRHYRRQTLVFSATLIKDVAWRRRESAKERAAAAKPRKGAGRFRDRKGSGKDGGGGGGGKETVREESVRKLMERLDLPEPPVIIDLCPHGKVSEKISQYRVNTVADCKDEQLYHFLLRHQGVSGGGRALVFVNAVGEARRIAHTLSLLRIRALLLHSGLQQRQRLKNLEAFKADPAAVLIATDVAARGLDIPAVEVVVHYHVPRAPALYVHRCGRTARGRVQSGVSLLLVSPQERIDYLKITDLLQQGEEDMPVYECSTAFFAAATKRMAAAKKLEAEMNRVGKAGREQGWLARQAAEMDIELEGEDLMDPDDAPGLDAASLQRSRRVQEMRAQLDRMLDSDLVPKGVNPRYITALPAALQHSAGAAPGLPELLRRDSGAAGPSAAPPVRGFAGGARVHRRKPMKPHKFGRRR